MNNQEWILTGVISVMLIFSSLIAFSGDEGTEPGTHRADANLQAATSENKEDSSAVAPHTHGTDSVIEGVVNETDLPDVLP